MNKLMLIVVIYLFIGLVYGSFTLRTMSKPLTKTSNVVQGLCVLGHMLQSMFIWIIPTVINGAIFVIAKIEFKLEKEKMKTLKRES